MKVSVILTVWISIVFLVILALYLSWQSAFSITERKVELIGELTQFDRVNEMQDTDFNVMIIGTSLSVLGFLPEDKLNLHFADSAYPVHFSKVTITASGAKELEPLIIKALGSQADLILVEINPWSLRFGIGHALTLHRYWLATLIQSRFGITPHRFIFLRSFMANNTDKFVMPNGASFEKFSGFQPYVTGFSPITLQALEGRADRVKFFYPNFARELLEHKGAAWQKKLKKAHLQLSHETGVELLPYIESQGYQSYTDLVHVNINGSDYYMTWLEKVVAEAVSKVQQ
ncbi:hypothetical protein [Shewanella donghaensis]|uniref:hypothetical protein n=1 Tax=Shewanella donghaensis TaxID=238836 RepID=UPI001183A740|nr:hypothetical protein [Shewanella donghaensis]